MRSLHSLAFIGLLAAAVILSESRFSGQISAPYSFVPGGTIRSSEVNANFAKFADALNRTGGTMTGTLTARNVAAVTHDTYDIGVTGTRFRNYYASGAFIGAVTGNVTGDVTGNVLAADGSVGTPGIRFSSDTNTGLYRIGADNFAVAIGGALRASWAATLNLLYTSTYGAVWGRDNGTAGVDLHVRAASDKDGCLSFTEDTDADRWAIRSVANDDKLYVGSGSCASPTAVANLDASTKTWTVAGTEVLSGVQNVTTADAGTEITLNDDTYMVRVTEGGTSSGDEILGLTGGVQGRSVRVCLVDDSVGGALGITNESGGATAANRVLTPAGIDLAITDNECVTLTYDGTSQRWRGR